MKNCSNPIQLLSLADALIDGLKAELFLTPKPGLVDLCNTGSHRDLTLLTMARSINLMRVYFKELTAGLLSPNGHCNPVNIGQQAEQRMFDQLATNCHKGGIFLCGLMLIAASRCDMKRPDSLQQQMAGAAAEIFTDQGRFKGSHGDLVRKEHPKSGIVSEALNGLPGVFEHVLPHVIARPGDIRGIFRAMAELMLYVDDSTTRHRGGDRGIAMLRAAGADLKMAITSGGDYIDLLIQMDSQFKRENLTMGGVADLLGIGLGYASYLQQQK